MDRDFTSLLIGSTSKSTVPSKTTGIHSKGLRTVFCCWNGVQPLSAEHVKKTCKAPCNSQSAKLSLSKSRGSLSWVHLYFCLVISVQIRFPLDFDLIGQIQRCMLLHVRLLLDWLTLDSQDQSHRCWLRSPYTEALSTYISIYLIHWYNSLLRWKIHTPERCS